MVKIGTEFITPDGSHTGEVVQILGSTAMVKIRIAPRRIVRKIFTVAQIEACLTQEAE